MNDSAIPHFFPIFYSAAVYLGYLPQDMLGHSVFDFYCAEDMNLLKDIYELGRNVYRHFRHCMTTSDGIGFAYFLGRMCIVSLGDRFCALYFIMGMKQVRGCRSACEQAFSLVQ